MNAEQILNWARRRCASLHYVKGRSNGEWLVGFNIPVGFNCWHHVTGRDKNILLAIKEAEDEAEAYRIKLEKIEADRKSNPPQETIIIPIPLLKRRRGRK